MDELADIVPISSESQQPRLLAASQVLLIPLDGADASDIQGLLPSGAAVRRGQSLIQSPRQGQATPLASVDGTLGSVVHARLLSGELITAVQLHPQGTAPSPVDVEPSPVVNALPGSSTMADSSGEATSENKREVTSPDLDLPTLISRLCAGGVRIDRVGSPDLMGQLLAALKRPVETVLCSFLEIDPTSRSISNVSRAEALAGLRRLGKALGAGSLLAVQDQSIRGSVLKAARQEAAAMGIELLTTKGEYPASHPTVLIHRLFKKRLRPRRLPTDVGVLMIDAQGAAEVARCLDHGEPMLTCRLDIHDWPRQRCLRLRVPVGMTLGQALQQVVSPMPAAGSLRAGALYRNVAVGPDTVCAGGEITVHVLPDLATVDVYPCIRAGWCVDICPTRVHPAGLVEAVQRNDLTMAQECGLDACIECGMCSWVCPSHLPLLQSIRTMLQLQHPSPKTEVIER